MARIFLIRHGEPAAAWGQAENPGLSDLGRRQAETAAQALAEQGGLQLISSPLARCQETAAPLASRVGAGVRIEPRVAEVPSPKTGDRRGWLTSTFAAAFSPEGRALPWAACGPDILAWRDAMRAALAEQREDAAIFTHFIAINALVSAALDRDENIVCRPAHASITELVGDGATLRLVKLGAQVEGGPVA